MRRQVIRSWKAEGGGAADLALDTDRHRLFVGTRSPARMTIYDSRSGKAIQSLPAPAAMDGVQFDPKLDRVYVTGGRLYGKPDRSAGRVSVYQEVDPDHYDILSQVETRPGSGTSLLERDQDRLYIASQASPGQEAAILVYGTIP